MATGVGIACAVGTGAAQESPTEIADWHDLDAVRENRTADYVLAGDLDGDTPGYDEHVGSPEAGWEPIGEEDDEFGGTFDGNGHEIRDLKIDRPESKYVGLFGGISGTLRDITLVGVEITGRSHVGGIVGDNDGQIHAATVGGNVTGNEMVGGIAGESPGNIGDSTASASVTGEKYVGGLVGYVSGDVRESSANGTVTGTEYVGGLVGYNSLGGQADPGGDIVDSTAGAAVTGEQYVGGLVGKNSGWGVIQASTTTGDVTGDSGVGGLVGVNDGKISDSFYDIDEVRINGDSALTVRGLFPEQYEDWQAEGEFRPEAYDSLTVDGTVIEIGDAQGVRDALAFIHDPDFGWRLTADLDLTGDAAGLYFPFVAREFDGNGHTITLNLALPGVDRVGAIGDSTGTVTDLSVEGSVTGVDQVGALVGHNRSRGITDVTADADVTGRNRVGGLVGENADQNDFGRGVDEEEEGRIAESTASGAVDGEQYVGGLVGENRGSVSDATASAAVAGGEMVGGLVGGNRSEIERSTASGDVDGDSGIGGLVGAPTGEVSNSHYNVEEVSINGEHALTVGGLFAEQYEDWQANDRELTLDAYDSLTVSDDYVEIGDEQSVRDALGFVGERQLDWRLTADLDLTGDAAGLYFPYVVGEFDGNGHTITLDLDLPAVSRVGAIGYSEGDVEDLTVEGSVTGANRVGGIVGRTLGGGLVDSAADCDVTGMRNVGGLVGYNRNADIERSEATGDVIGDTRVGGVAGWNGVGIITATASGTVAGTEEVGGIVGANGGSVLRSATETSVSGERAVGGVAGSHSGRVIENSLVLGEVIGGARVGGMAGVFGIGQITTSIVSAPVDGEEAVGAVVGDNTRGYLHSSGTVTGIYWDTVVTGQQAALGDGDEISGDVTGLTTEQMQGEAAAEQMPALDFEEVWTVDPEGYPTLREQTETAEPEPAESDDESGPGFGLGSALGSLGGVAYLLSRRRGSEPPNEE